MGCELYAFVEGEGKGIELNLTSPSYLVMDWTSPWFDRLRDTDSDGYHQVGIDESAVREADKIIPLTYPEYLVWAEQTKFYTEQQISPREPHSEREFTYAREFLRKAAIANQGVHVSF